MSGVNNLIEPNFIPNNRYEIKTIDGFKSFSGLIFGESEDLYSYEDKIYTAEHLIKNDGDFKLVKDIGIKVNKKQMMYDPFEVEGGHTYITKDGKEHHNCQTGEQFVDIFDKVTNEKMKVTLKELEKMILLDNAGLDYKTSTIINIQ